MAQATSTALGEIKLAGDLAGSNNALIPELSATGVAAGQYIAPTITVDAKGRILTAAATTGATLTAMFPDATTSSKGIVQVGSGLNVNAGVVAADIGSTVQKGIVQVGDGLVATAGVVSLDWGDFPVATNSSLGVMQVGTGLTSASGVVSLDTTALPVATGSVAGAIKVGSGLSINAGVLSTTAVPDATTSSKGIVQVGTGLSVSSGTISADVGTGAAKGILQVGDGLFVSSGTVSLNRSSYASPTVAGLVKVGNGLQIDGSGVLNINQATLPDATTSVRGLVTVGSGINIASGIISIDPLPIATASTLGTVKVGSNLSVDGSGTLSVSYTYPDATTSSKGILKVDTTNGLTISAGVLNVAQASNTNLGVVSVPNTGPLSVNGAGELQVATATASALGVVKVDGTTIVDDGYGRISVNVPGLPVASTTVKGILQAGNGINATAGVLSLASAYSVGGNHYPGIVQVDGDTIQVNAGVISVDTTKFMLNNTYISNSKAIHCAKKTFITATSNTNYNLDLQESNTFVVTAQGASVALGFYAPSNMSVGMTFRIILNQGSTPTTVQPSFNAAFVFPSAYTMTGNAMYGDVLECTVISGSKVLTKVLATNQYMIG